MKSKFAIAGHPIHPMLVVVPIGLFVWALVSDFIYLGTDKDKMWYDIAFWTGIAAIISAVIAALPGFGDFLTLAAKSDARTMALTHMVLNLGVVLLYLIAMLLMLDDGATDGGSLATVIVLHAIGVAGLLVSGWIGGEMVYRHHLGMVADDEQESRGEYERHARRPTWAGRS
ncbi:MAG: DUF2231 domain-containing protein [Hyphomicrobiales bacterium]